ncbi:MAG: carboxy terminal-processing peptidase [Saprospiraceae bacterium]|nr:carboxy terminal-processing peptidase [Saprospiraceae bacterium]
MRFKPTIFIALLAGVLAFGAFSSFDDVPYEERETLILHGVLSFIKQAHVNPKPIDDSFSKEVFKTYLKRIDVGKRFLVQSDVDKLKTYELDLDDQANRRTLEFFDASMELLDAGIARSEVVFNDVIDNHDFDYTIVEEIELDSDKTEFAKDEAGLKDYWRKYLKYDIVQKFTRKKSGQEDAIAKEKQYKLDVEEGIAEADEERKPAETKTDEQLLIEAKEESKENFTDLFERLNKLRRSDRFETYLSAITNYFDPHTDYFNPKAKQDFDINMGGKLEGIGARLTVDGDYTKVLTIIPGGPAYQGKELEVDDLIVAVKQEEGEAVDIVGWRIDDVVQKIRGKKGTVVTLTTKKKDGSIVDIEIERDRVIIDESFARSALIDLPGTANNIGYIKLPKFYSSFENEDGNSCAVDVAKEIEKLKNENVNGIILDLRNNTGGSLSDVVDMTGLFIEEGPIVQVKPKDRPAYVHNDKDSEVQYDGPLIVMTNHLSASASEILAAALQDYDRALIVGSKSTFGKGSVQRFFDLDRALQGNTEFKPLGNLKISMQKFYRVNGGSTQLRGVTPDIILPDNYHFIETGEKEYENALEWDQIEKKDYNQDIVKLQNKSKIVALSEKRVKEDEKFNLILENAQRLKDNRDQSSYPISISGYDDLIQKRKDEAKKFENIFDEEVDFLSVRNMAVDTAYINADESRVGRNESWLEGIKSDFYLEETLFILRDLINLEESYSSIEEKFKTSEKKVIKP